MDDLTILIHVPRHVWRPYPLHQLQGVVHGQLPAVAAAAAAGPAARQVSPALGIFVFFYSRIFNFPSLDTIIKFRIKNTKFLN